MAVSSSPCPKAAVPSSLHSQIPTLGQHSHCLFPCSGLIPRLLGDILSLWLCNMLAYLINTYALDNGVGSAPASQVPGAGGGAAPGMFWEPPPRSGGTQVLLLLLRSPP